MRASHFEYYNPNPKELRTCDCMIRAFCKALDKDWYEVFDLLNEIAKKNCMPFNAKEMIDIYAKEFGFNKVRISALKRGERSINPEKFCKDHPTGTYILSMAHHTLCAKDGKYWDLSPEISIKRIYSYWEKV